MDTTPFERFGPFPNKMRPELETLARERFGVGHCRVTATVEGAFVEGDWSMGEARCFFDNLLGAVQAESKAEARSTSSKDAARGQVDKDGFVIARNGVRMEPKLPGQEPPKSWGPMDVDLFAWSPFGDFGSLARKTRPPRQ